MKRRLFIGFVIFIVLVLQLPNIKNHWDEKEFTIADAAMLMIQSNETETTLGTSDASHIDYITSNINGLIFNKGESSEDFSDWTYRLVWFDKDGNETEEILILSDKVIDYNGSFYVAKSAGMRIDIAYIDKLLEEFGEKQ